MRQAVPSSGLTIYRVQHHFVLYHDPTDPAICIGLPVIQGGSGQWTSIVDPSIPIVTVDPSIPIVTVNLRSAPVFFHDRPTEPFLRVGPFNASLAAADVASTTIKIAPPETLTHLNGVYMLPSSSIFWDPSAVSTPPVLKVNSCAEHTPAEARTMMVRWTPDAAKETRQVLCDSLTSCGHPIERVERCGDGEARIIFRSPYSVLSILSGQPHLELILDDGQSIVCAQEHFCQDNKQKEAPFNADNMLSLTFDLAQRVHYVDITTFFNRFGKVVDVTFNQESDGDEQPKSAVVTFQTSAPVKEFLGGQASVTFYIWNKQLRAKPFSCKE